jgi:tetratricopeptide (TPR) repeat protein
LGERRALATALRVQGVARVRLGALAEAQSDLQRALDLFREIGDLREVARALGSLGYLFQNRGDFALARTATLEVLQLASDIGDERGSALATMNLAETDFALGEIDDAVARASSNLEREDLLCKGSEHRAAQESNLAAYLVALGRYDEARSMALASIEDSDTNYLAIPLQHLTAVIAPSHPQRAARLLGYVEKVFALTPFSRQITEQYTYNCIISTLRQTMEDDEIARLGRDGSAMSEDQILKLARLEPTRDSTGAAGTPIRPRVHQK